MQKKVVIGFSSIIIAATLLFSDILNSILTFLLAGIIPGTHIVAPYWFMMAVYCALISLIATPYLERILKLHYDRRHPAKKTSRLPRRRYSHI